MKRRAFRVLLLALVLLSLLGSSTFTAAAQGTSDLSLTIVADRDKVKRGETITFTVTVTNLGPDVATFVGVVHSLPDQLQFVSLTCDRGVSNDGDFCEYSSLDPGAKVVSTLVATPLTGTGMMKSKYVITVANASFETADTVDPDTSNNTGTVSTKLIAVQIHR